MFSHLLTKCCSWIFLILWVFAGPVTLCSPCAFVPLSTPQSSVCCTNLGFVHSSPHVFVFCFTNCNYLYCLFPSTFFGSIILSVFRMFMSTPVLAYSPESCRTIPRQWNPPPPNAQGTTLQGASASTPAPLCLFPLFPLPWNGNNTAYPAVRL